MGDEEKSKASSTARLALWLSFIAFLLLIFLFRSSLTEITFGEKGVSAKMMNSRDASKLSPEERQAADRSLNDRIANLEKQASAHPQPAPVAQPAAETPASGELSNATYREPQGAAQVIDISGWWSAIDTSTFQITQNGSYVTLQGYMFGQRLLAGTGTLSGQVMTLQTLAVTGETGTLELQLSPDQRHLSGGFRSATTGIISAIQLNR
jgi:hypothetical protein